MNRRTRIAALSGSMVALVGVAVFIAIPHLGMRRHPEATPAAPATGQTPTYWYDPMHPDQHFDKPGKSPFMDMELVPKYAGSASRGSSTSGGSIEIDPRVIQTLGIRLATAEPGSVSPRVDTVGLVAVDEHRIEAIQVRASGWVERLDVRAVGDPVRRGQLLAGIYSPDLLATQQEYLIARSANDPSLLEAARGRLGLFGLSDTQMSRIERAGQVERRIDYYAPFDGYVMQLGARQGAAVEPGTTLFQLANLRSVWMIAQVPEAQAAWFRTGDPAQAEVPALPGERFVGKIDYLYPELDADTRTLKVRVVLNNPKMQLRPGMFATAHLRGSSRVPVLTVPTEAVIETGARSIVIVAEDATHFRAAAVRVGAENGGRSEILAGIEPGQTVVASGQFLIDSEANLRGAVGELAGTNESPDDAKRMLSTRPGAPSPDEAH
jgi:Cu(I)/Ag(I) efflux system membrane fusion protein